MLLINDTKYKIKKYYDSINNIQMEDTIKNTNHSKIKKIRGINTIQLVHILITININK